MKGRSENPSTVAAKFRIRSLLVNDSDLMREKSNGEQRKGNKVHTNRNKRKMIDNEEKIRWEISLINISNFFVLVQIMKYQKVMALWTQV